MLAWHDCVASLRVIALLFACGLQGKGEFTMEYQAHMPVTADVQAELTSQYRTARAAGNK